ncbi:hypothetical protein SAMN04488137_4527 [Fictibacillus solisalsi]|uniref:Uncharacterized protein n=1 Tax=Fictibacillus solisalsi TaxID=459525 RepID=A0A1H0BK10_9BACL|nr:hypothetical protein [Fictibacillus solisalsi]SDN45986.1 hypothetical protein SAMN04488137_4527 [Fictibacillus solisalsi]
MIFEVFNNSTYIGDFQISDFFENKDLIANGSILNLNNKNYCVGNICVRNDGTIVLEVH